MLLNRKKKKKKQLTQNPEKWKKQGVHVMQVFLFRKIQKKDELHPEKR